MTAELSVVHTGIGHQAALSCIVNANPQAVVRWYRESLLLDSDNNFLLESKGTLHTFIIRKVRKENFGTFSCSASNTFGKQTAHVLVTGMFKKASSARYFVHAIHFWPQGGNFGQKLSTCAAIMHISYRFN